MTRSPTPTALERLKAQRDKLNARIQDGEARDKARERRQQRQRQIVVGTFILEQAHRDGDYAELVAQLDVYLTRANDRQLFDLPPRAPVTSAAGLTLDVTTATASVAEADDDVRSVIRETE